jgi:vacuolar-type H+-ATPase subunit I/STV1
MFYCTIYVCEGKKNKIPDSEKLYPFKCLSYTSKAEAESFKNTFIEEAKALEVGYFEQDGYTVLSGNITFSFAKWRLIASESTKTFVIGIEDDTTKLSKVFAERVARFVDNTSTLEDGKSYENKVAMRRQRFADEEAKAERKKEQVISQLNSELSSAQDLPAILKTLIKFSKKNIDKDLLISTVATKIQKPSESWYDELSDINN